MYKVLEVNVDDHLHGGVYAMMTEVIRLRPPDIKIDIAALEPFDRQENIDALRAYDCRVFYVGASGNKILKQIHIYQNVKALIMKQQYDVVHLHSDVAHKILVSALAARKCGVKRILFHSHANDVEGRFPRLRRLFHKSCARLLKGIPAIYLATSDEAGKWMYPFAPRDMIRVLRNGVAYERFYFDKNVRDAVRKELNLENAFLLGAFGRFVYQKNPFYLLELLPRVLAHCPETHLLCIGEGPLRDDFLQEAHKQGLTEHITVLNITDHIERYYQAIDVLLLPSNFEGFGLVAVEAQISDTPVIASDKVPAMTKITDKIAYLPIDADSAKVWSEAIIRYRGHLKGDMRGRISLQYDIRKLTDELAQLYRV